jgi:hypothetical protein
MKTRHAKPYWERGYESHGYWQGKKKIGWVTLEGKGKSGVYRWQAGSRAGEAKTLPEAKRAVEVTSLSLATQLSLFGDPAGD